MHARPTDLPPERHDNEDRRHRRHRPDRLEARRASSASTGTRPWPPPRAPASTRSPARASPTRSQGADGRRRRLQLAVVRGRGGAGVLPDVDPQPARRRGRRPASATTSRCRSWAPTACPDSGYLRAKVAQEKLIEESPIPYSIVHATQFFEFVNSIADAATDGDTVRLPPALHPADRGRRRREAVGRVATGAPLNGIVEVGGPEPFRLDELIREALTRAERPAPGRRRPRRALLRHQARRRQPAPRRRRALGEIRFEDWLGAFATAR